MWHQEVGGKVGLNEVIKKEKWDSKHNVAGKPIFLSDPLLLSPYLSCPFGPKPHLPDSPLSLLSL